jgi:hypothetical protein
VFINAWTSANIRKFFGVCCLYSLPALNFTIARAGEKFRRAEVFEADVTISAF